MVNYLFYVLIYTDICLGGKLLILVKISETLTGVVGKWKLKLIA